MRAGGFDWPNNEQTLATSTHIGHCPGMMEPPTILKKLVVIERRFYPNLHIAGDSWRNIPIALTDWNRF